MALTNFSLPFGGSVSSPNWITTASPIQHHVTAVNDLLYSPEGHQPVDRSNGPKYYKNDPYAPPSQSSQHHNQQQQQQPQPLPQQYQRQSTYQYRSHNNYLPPLTAQNQQIQRKTQHIPQLQPPPAASAAAGAAVEIPRRTVANYQSHHQTRTYGEGNYESHEFYSENISSNSFNDSDSISQRPYDSIIATPQPQLLNEHLTANNDAEANGYPAQRPTYTRVQAGQGSKTQVHAVLDYDNDDDYYDEENPGSKDPLSSTLSPIQGPIFLRNGSVPIIPLFSFSNMNNGSFVRIPIWWTALSVALGLEIQGDVIKGTPCVKRNYQLFCPTAGNNYPIDRIEEFIDENKALMRRMYGDFREKEPNSSTDRPKQKRNAKQSFDNIPGVPDLTAPFNTDPNIHFGSDEHYADGESYFGRWRTKRQSNPKPNKSNSNGSKPNPNANPTTEPSSGRVDACESKTEIVTPYWASNSAGKIRAIVNTQHFEQAIHQEVCTKKQTSRCGGDCGCEQKYKWHRLLAYDPDNDCKGIFMDWFLFPSCCVCRCNPN